MKPALLAVLAIGLPLTLMMLVWQQWTGQSGRVDSAHVDHPDATRRQNTEAKHSALSVRRMDPATRPSLEDVIDRLEDSFAAMQTRISPGIPEALDDPRRIAASHLVKKEFDRGAAAFDRLLVKTPDDPVLLLGKAMALTGLGRHDDALPLYEHVIEREPNNLIARFNLAVALMRTGQRDASANAFQAILKMQPNHVQAKFNLAILHQAAARWNESIALWRELTGNASAPTTSPSDAKREPSKVPSPANPGLELSERIDAWSHRGEVALALYLNDEAQACFNAVLHLAPNDARAWCNLGIARAGVGQQDQAIVALNEALRLDPQLVPAINQLAMIHAANYRDTQDAASKNAVLKLCQRSLRIAPDQPNMRELRKTIWASEE